jgi:hypothetical protein
MIDASAAHDDARGLRHRPLVMPHVLVHRRVSRMIFYHHGAAIHASATRLGNLFIARASILEEDGEATSLGDLGVFANRTGARQFAIRCATAFIDGHDMPLPPYAMQTPPAVEKLPRGAPLPDVEHA